MPDLVKRPFDPSKVSDLAALVASDPFISVHSRWSGSRWTLEGRTPGYNERFITWRPHEMPGELLNEFKMLAASLFLPRAGQLPQLKYSSAPQFSIASSYLARFMAEKSYVSLTELDQAAFVQFQDYVEASAMNSSLPHDLEPDGEEEDADDRNDDGEPPPGRPAAKRSAHDAVTDDVEIDRPTLSFVALRLQIWSHLHQARADLRRAGLAVDLPDLFAKETLPLLAKRLSARSLSNVEDLPDEVVMPILTEANRLIGEPAEQAIALFAEYMELGPLRHQRDREHTRSRRRLVAKHIKRLKGEQRTWFETERDADPSLVVNEVVRTVRDACFVVLAAGIGWRISEAASIEVEPQEDDRLPSCLFITRSYSGTSDHFWVRGLLSKHRPEPTPDDWLIGARLSGSEAEPPTVRAIRVLERLFRPLRQRAPSDMLRRQLVLNFSGSKVSWEPLSIHRIRNHAIREGMQRWIKERAGLKEALAPLVANNPRLQPYFDEEGENVRPHQWRRTFFRLLYRQNDKLLPAISRHFKHVSLAVTENGYAPRTPAAVQERDAAMTEQLVARLFARAEGQEPPVTGAEVMLDRQRKVLSAIIGGDPLEKAAPRLAEFAARRDLRLWPAEHGGCLIGLNPDRAACHVRDGRIDWRADRPNLTRRNPSLCCSCPNLIVTAKDLPFWQRRYRENRMAWLTSGQDPAFRFARDRAAQAKTIIEHLGGTPARVSVRKEKR